MFTNSDCPHQSSDRGAIRCELLATQGLSLVAPPGNPNHPCARCRSQWTDDQPPTADNLTPAMLDLLAMVGLRNAPPREPPRPPCYHLGRVISRPCNCPMKFSHHCDLLGRPVSRGTDCRACESWESEA